MTVHYSLFFVANLQILIAWSPEKSSGVISYFLNGKNGKILTGLLLVKISKI